MGGGRCSACGVCDDLLQKIARTFLCISVSEHRRQPSTGVKHNFLRLVSVHLCEPHLGSHCRFYNCHQETSFVSLGTGRYLVLSCSAKRNISGLFPVRSRSELNPRFFASLRMTIRYGCHCDWNTIDMWKVNL